MTIAELIGLPFIIKHIENLEKKTFQQLYENMTAKEVIDLFYSSKNEDNKK